MIKKTVHPVRRASRRRRWLAALTALLFLIQAGAALRALRIPHDLAARVSLLLPLEFMSGIFWALVSALVALELWRSSSSAYRHLAWLIIGFLSYSLLRLILFTQADYDRQRLPLLVVVTIVVLIMPAAAILRPIIGHKIRTTEIIEHGHQSQN